jgi:hypothetical protein
MIMLRHAGLMLFIGLGSFKGQGAALAVPPSALDRQHLIAHLEMTESWLADEVSRLSPAQVKFRPKPNSWSVLDCVAHLSLAEPEYWAMFKHAMEQRPSRKESPSEDIDRMWYGIDRTQKATTTQSETPKGRFSDIAPALAGFRSLRGTILEYVRTSQEDWRHHLIAGWDRDAYQWLLMISAHSQRHILQIREIRHDANFPVN